MINLGRVFHDYEHSGALNALVNVHAAIDDHTFLTKGGDLLVILKVEGVDAECLDPLPLDQIIRRFGSSMRTFDERFRIYQYLIKRDYGRIPHGDYADPVVRETVDNRAAYLEAKGLYGLEIYFAVVHEAPRRAASLGQRASAFAANPAEAIRAALSTENRIAILDQEIERARELLTNKVTTFAAQLSDFIKIGTLDKGRAFGFLRRLLNYTPYKSDGVNLAYNEFVDFQACGSSLECYRDHLRLDDYLIQTLTLKDPPSRTSANLLKGLQELPAQFVIATEWKRAGNASIRRLIGSKRRHFFNSKVSFANYLNTSGTAPKDVLTDVGAAGMVADLGSCLEELDVNGNYFGEFSLTVVLYDRDHARLKRAVAECFKVFASVDAQLTEERYNLLNAWLAVLPGNHAFNLRRMWLTNTNYADLSLLSAPHTGAVRNDHLGTEYLSVFETNSRTPYFFNFHNDDVAHTFLLGATGSGKSFTLSFLLTDLQKYRPLTYIFDLGGSYERLTRQFGGTYVPVGPGKRSFTINPLSLPATPENLQFLCCFIRVLAESGGGQVTAQDERDLFEQIQNLYAVEPEQRRLLTLANILGRNLRQSLQKWVQGGQHGTLFDNVEDNLTFARFQTFDFEGMDKVPEVLEPLLFYILHRAQTAIYDPQHRATFKVFVIDEAWRFFQNPTIRLYIQEALKTWRKKNAAMILATQSIKELEESGMLQIVSESCPTKIFLANPEMNRDVYREAFHLNDTELDLIAGLVPPGQMLIRKAQSSKKVQLNVDSVSHWMATNNARDNLKKRDYFERFGIADGLRRLAEDFPFRPRVQAGPATPNPKGATV